MPTSSWCSGQPGFINVSSVSCCRKLISLRPVSPQTEAERLWSPEDRSSKIKLFRCIVMGSWKRRGMPTYGYHTQNTLGISSAVSYSSFHVLKMRQRPCTHTPTPCAVCTAHSMFVLIAIWYMLEQYVLIGAMGLGLYLTFRVGSKFKHSLLKSFG